MLPLHPETLLFAVLLFGVFATLAHLIVHSQLFAALLLVVLFCLTSAVRDQVALSATLGSIRVSALDALCVFFLVVGVYRAATIGLRIDLQGAVLALLLLLFFHFARGVADFGLQEAANGTRSWLHFLAPLLFAATVPFRWGGRIWHVIAFAGLGLVFVCVPYLLTEGVHSASHQIVRNGEIMRDSPITSAGALLILEAAVLFFALRWPSPGASGVCGAIAVGGVVVLQHRSVWVAGLAVLLVGFVTWSRVRLPDDERLVFGATSALCLAAPLAVWGFLSAGPFVASLKETTDVNSTFSWRTQSWQELISSHHSALDIASGGPAGASWARPIAGQIAVQSPHNAFVEAFLRFGLPGVTLFVALLLVLWVRRQSVSSHMALTGNAVGLILIAQAIYSIPYMLSPIQGLILGVFVSSFAFKRSEARHSRASEMGEFAGRIAFGRA